MDLKPGSTNAEYTVVVHREDGSFWAEVEEMPGCFAAGDTEEELEASLTEAVGLYLSSEDLEVRVELTHKTQLDDVRRESVAVELCAS